MPENIEMNKPLWEAMAKVHEHSEFYDLAGFIKRGDSLPDIDLHLLGDIQDKRILHLQCHIGQESISLAKRGAQVTAVDFSGRAIAIARKLSAKMNVHVNFINRNVYDLESLNFRSKFDIVYCSYGCIPWLYDLHQWSKLIYNQLSNGGRFILVEFHPLLFTFDEPEKIIYNYGSTAEPEICDMNHSYTGDPLDQSYSEYCWNHSISQVLSALLKHQFILKDFQEYDYSPQPCFNEAVEVEPNKFRLKAFEKISFPYVFSAILEK